MSEEDFIYSAIADDNVNAFDLTVIANTLASTDKLVRQNKDQREENERLREKISSLRESALQIKNLYETEVSKAGRAEAQLANYVSQCQQLEQRCLVAENERVNTDLLLKERIAEYDRKIETNETRYRGLVSDLVRYHSDNHKGTHTGDSAIRWKDLKLHAVTADKLDLPDEVKAFFHHAQPTGQTEPRKKRKKCPEMRDQECQTNVETVATPRVQHTGTNTVEPYPAQKDPPIEKKTFSDKGTMHSTMSTITRSTCTSAFIKRVDVGVNFPEVTHKSVDEILRECVPLPPLLLSPITEILPLRATVETQTDLFPTPEPHPASPPVKKPQLVSCGTITSLKNIRKRIDYRAVEGGVGVSSFQQTYISIAEQLYAKKIKKEEQMSSATPPGFGQDDTFGQMHPHLSTIWTLLGETIFSLMGSPGRRFDGQCYGMINDQLATIRDMIEADGRRESELMSAMFSNVSATVEAAAGYGKERATSFPARVVTTTTTQEGEPPPPTSPQPFQQLPGGGCAPVECPTTPAVSSFVGHCQAGPNIDREQVASKDDALSAQKEPLVPPSLSCPTQTKEINEGVNATGTVTRASPTALKVDHPLNANVRMEKGTEKAVAQSKDTIDSIEAVPGGSTEAAERTEPALSSVVVDEENDSIAQELRLMEEGEDDGHDGDVAHSPAGCALRGSDEKPGPSSIEDILAGRRIASAEATLGGGLVAGDSPQSSSIGKSSDISTSSVVDGGEPLPPPERPSTPPRIHEPDSNSTATFVSPIKVKETNDLVKDQFKTPTQLPISKRKLRTRRSEETPAVLPPSYSPKRARLSDDDGGSPADTGGRCVSPTTEFLLEDDWDEKFSSIKAAMFVPSQGAYRRPLSPIADRIEPDDYMDTEGVTDITLAAEDDSSVLQQQEAAPSVPTVGEVLVDNEPVEIGPIIDRIANEGSQSKEESSEGSKNHGTVEMEVDNIEREPNRLVERVLSIEKTTQEKISPPQANASDAPQAVGSEPETNKPIVRQQQVAIAETTRKGGVINEASHDGNIEMVSSRAKTVHLPSAGGIAEEGEIVDNDGEQMERSKTGELKIIVDAAVLLESPESPVWESPMSPPAHETVSSISSPAPVSYYSDSPLSPPLVSRGDVVAAPPPRPIPLDHVNLHRLHARTRGPLDRALECYNIERRFEVCGRFQPQEKGATQKLSKVLQRYLKSPWTDEVVAETIEKLLAISQDARTIALTMLDTVASRKDNSVNMHHSPPAPPIPVTQQKLVLLVRHLAPQITQEPFDRVLMRELDRRVFQLKSDAAVPLPGLIALTFLYIGLEDSRPPTLAPWFRTYSVRLYIFKCLYYFGFKCLPLVYYVLRAFPFALPKKDSPHYDKTDAIIGTIRTILMNIKYSDSGKGNVYKKSELFALLKYHYGYQSGSPTYDELVVNLVEKIRANRLRNVPYALMLVAKRKSYAWARQHIIQRRLYPLLNDYLKLLDLMGSGAGSAPSGSGPALAGSSTTTTSAGCDLVGLDERIVACIFTISSIMKTHPPDEDVSGVMQIFTSIVQLARGHQAIQEEAIAGLVKFSRFGQADIFERISHWKPTYPVSDRIKLMLATLLHRKDLMFWKQLIENKIV